MDDTFSNEINVIDWQEGKGNPRCNNTTAVCYGLRSDQSVVQKKNWWNSYLF